MMKSETPLIKICGMKSPENIRSVIKMNPAMIGFIFHPDSARDVSDVAGSLPFNEIPAHILKVAVVVDKPLEECREIVTGFGFDALQLHGKESPEFCRAMRAYCMVIKSFHVAGALPVQMATYEGSCDYFLFDTAGMAAGGTGKSFDHQMLYAYKGKTPYLVAGGIGPDEASRLLTTPPPKMAGLDLNSRFEVSPGLKDIRKLQKTFTFMKETSAARCSGADPDCTNLNAERSGPGLGRTPDPDCTNLNAERSGPGRGRTPDPDINGYYGEFGGAFIPELLQANVDELSASYLSHTSKDSFKKNLNRLLADYVGRPTPLYYASTLSATYGARIYLKREDLCHTGAHKLNNVVGQALLAKSMKKKHIVAETGAGQHGVATATVCAMLGMPCIIFMGVRDTQRQQINVLRMKMLGAEVVPVSAGSQTLKDATNEALRYWINHPDDTYYLIGSSIGPHPYPDMVARFQSVISKEIQEQLFEKEGNPAPDYVLACVGGGSNAAGAFYHFVDNEITRLIGAEAAGKGLSSGQTAATLSVGSAGVLHGTRTILMQTADGQVIEAHSISAGLDYPGVGPMHAWLHQTGRARFLAVTDEEAMEAARELTLSEGIIPAIESAHALALLGKLPFSPDDVVVVSLSGRGDKDMETYGQYYENNESQ